MRTTAKELTAGQPMYRINFGDSVAWLGRANFVRRRRAWYRWRNIETGEEWNENGRHFYKTKQEAIKGAILGVTIQMWAGSVYGESPTQEEESENIEKLASLFRLKTKIAGMA